MFISPELLKQVVFWGKISGAVSGIGTVVYGILKYPVKWIRQNVHQNRETNQNVTLLVTNHIPHLNEAIITQGTALTELKSVVRDNNTKLDGLGQRLDDTKEGVHTLGQAFLQHLENSARPEKKSKAKK